MSNRETEITAPTREGEQTNLNPTQSQPVFDALQLHKDGAALNAPLAVADNNLKTAVENPAESTTLMASTGAHVENVAWRAGGGPGDHRGGYGYGHGYGYGYGYGGPRIDFGITIGDPYVYDNVAPAYGNGYYGAVPETCYPSPYYNAPPVCAPIVPEYGPGFYGPGIGFYDRYRVEPRYEPRYDQRYERYPHR